MSRTRPLLLALCRPLVLLVLLTLLVQPGVALAADTVGVPGTVTARDGSPAAGVEVLVVVRGSDTARSTTTDDAGSFVLEVAAGVGDTLEIRATGATVRAGPDEDGCTTSTTPTGAATVAIEALPIAPVALVMDTATVDRVCPATATPGQPTKRPHARPTPPPTDSAGGQMVGHGGWVAIVAGLACLSAGLLPVARRRRDRRAVRGPVPRPRGQ